MIGGTQDIEKVRHCPRGTPKQRLGRTRKLLIQKGGSGKSERITLKGLVRTTTAVGYVNWKYHLRQREGGKRSPSKPEHQTGKAPSEKWQSVPD